MQQDISIFAVNSAWDDVIMKRVNDILSDSEFRENLKKIEEFEKDRIYCRHGMNHLLDVARIAGIHALDDGVNIDREVIYAAALLHDIGRACQYETGEDHDKAGVAIAGNILNRCDFDKAEVSLIIDAIAGHRGENDNSEDLKALNQSDFEILKRLIKTADNESRLCFMCEAKDSCKWSDSRKNKLLIV